MVASSVLALGCGFNCLILLVDWIGVLCINVVSYRHHHRRLNLQVERRLYQHCIDLI